MIDSNAKLRSIQMPFCKQRGCATARSAFVSSTASRSSGIKIQVIYGKQVISVRERRPNVYYLRNDYESPYIANYTVNDYHYHLLCATDGLK